MKRTGKYEKKNKMRLPISAYLTYLLVATLLFTGVNFSKFATTSSGEDSARVAKFAVTENSVETEKIVFSDLIPGDTKTWEFTVSFDCEVAAQCKMLLTSTGNLPLQYILTHDGKMQEVNLSDLLEIYQVAAGYNGTQTFTLTATWDEDDNNIEYMGMADAITLSIITEQID